MRQYRYVTDFFMAVKETNKRKFRFPIMIKTIVMIFLFAAVVVEVAIAFYAIMMSKRNNETYNNIANNLSGTVSEVVNKDDFLTVKTKVKSIIDTLKDDPVNKIAFFDDEQSKIDAYMSNFAPLASDADYLAAFDRLKVFAGNIAKQNKSHYVTDVYLSYVDYYELDGKKVGMCVYLVDPDEEDPCPSGWLDHLYDINAEVLDNPARGFPAYQTNTSYGCLISGGTAITNGTDVLGYAFVDISMDAIRARQADGITRLFIYLASSTVLIIIIGVVAVHFLFTKPLLSMSKLATSFDNDNPEKTHEAFTKLKPYTHDELSDLAESLKTMENGIYERMNKLVEVNDELSESQKEAERMKAIANKDSLTGVQSKTAYDSEVERINTSINNKEVVNFGIAMVDLNYLKSTNDEFGHDAGDDALIKLSKIICLTFVHSPVYRIGGDEFVVILRGNDYRNAHKLVFEFKSKIYSEINNKSLLDYERVSAAIGLATFDDSKDVSVDDVFKRADKEMYENKHRMKEK